MYEYVVYNDMASTMCCDAGQCGGNVTGAWTNMRTAWKPEYPAANRIFGGEGAQFHFPVTSDQLLPVYINQMFRCAGVLSVTAVVHALPLS
jgi:hypothetical protein